ncbi:hypothetical protein ACFQZX_03675 [Mucilaginibacter litoreus]|uniref:Phospholipase/Carboxylesterase n=1 Tax=Mucilaginibacter litoreus TaxID=1048221 RepID=A0ABW3APD4_9SPHI
MKHNYLLTLIGLILPSLMCAQNLPLPAAVQNDDLIASLAADSKVNADSALYVVSNWSRYPNNSKNALNYVYYYNDAVFGKVPVRVFVPANYNKNIKTPCIIMLHGAVGQSKFSDIDSTGVNDDDMFFDAFKNKGYIIIRPIGDRSKKFDWVVDRFSSPANPKPNLTYKALTNILIALKSILNIDDDRVFAFGHSDGSDGAVGLGVYSPDMFAAIIGYNSMLTNIFAYDYYIRNIKNRNLYLVHSDLDDIRPIQTTRDVIEKLKAEDNRIVYKEYRGYEHYDKHLNKDMPLAAIYMSDKGRYPYQHDIYWETASDTLFNQCDWLKITGINTNLPAAAWQQNFDVKAYDKSIKAYRDNMLYYNYLSPSAVAKAHFANNIFDIKTSRVMQLQVLISPAMVNLNEPVTIKVNGKQVFNGKVSADKQFILQNFKTNHDRRALWVKAIDVKVD